MARLFFGAIVLILTLGLVAPALAQIPDDEVSVRAVIADWYQRVGQREADRPWLLMAPGGVNGGPDYHEPVDLHSGSAAIRGPYINNELAGRALKFSYDIDVLKVDEHFAKAWVWERGYFYAWAAQTTYENAASTLFIFEKQHDGAWKILAHQAVPQGIPPDKITDPMPDLHDLYYSTAGKNRDPQADAANVPKF